MLGGGWPAVTTEEELAAAWSGWLLAMLQVIKGFYAGAFHVDSGCIVNQRLSLRSTGS